MKRFLCVLLCAVLAGMLLPAMVPTASAESLTHFNIRLNEPVASYTPDFTPEFSTGGTVYSNVTWKENSPGFNMTLNSSDEFQAGIAYKAEIWVKFGDGNYLATDIYGDLAAALTVNGQAISALRIDGRNEQGQINQVTITCEYAPLAGRQISSVMITGIPTPIAGNMPIYSFTLGNSAAYNYYHTEPIVWRDASNNSRQLGSGDTFIQGHKYQLEIWLSANRSQGCTFRVGSNGNPQVDATLNSWAADSVITAYEQDPREVISILYTFPACQAAHTCAPTLVKQQDPTCLLSGFKAYYACSCGKNFEDAAGKKEITDMDGYGIIPANGHKEGQWSYNGTHHYKKCLTCKEVIPGTNAAHSGGTATCVKKAVCATCNVTYGNTDSEHKWSPTYLYKDSKGHAWVCADCKTHDTVKPHTPGPEATDTKPQTCTDCGYIIVPAKNHTHELIQMPEVAPTCIASGTVAHYACSGCTALFSDAEGKKPLPADTNVVIPPLGHTTSDTWGFDAEYHWRTCTTCKEVLSETHMLHDAAEGKCPTCGHTVGQEVTPTETKPVPVPTQPGKQEGSSGSGAWIIAVVVGILCFGAGIGAAILILKKKTK